ncbi:intraflagellar transport protein 22 homolog isoform X2 [Bombus affinis]|uniref:Intraflagellar transport protein 22 homolog isoform X2 n=1 Tax=Bombus terrestris TaxID=30195 RepID=A0A9C6SDG9_BOMTE|nr:intraflagellar transport protein 22 homolog isoform X2 [Bombus terrestris]XP_050576396.1 intraflagellar transport protein 22 homolog isoform X2 [Bombus affinis]
MATIFQTLKFKYSVCTKLKYTYNMQPLKIIVIGPIRSGKTTISNFLADATEIPYDYHPTKGVRILEFEVQNINVNNKHIAKDVELWDCSGDYNCWPAIRKDVHGVILVYNEKSNECLKEIQQLYDYFIDQTKLDPDRCAIFCYDPEKRNPEISKIISSTFMKVSHVKCNIESGGSKLKADFASFISTILNKMHHYTNQGDKNILNENILFAK